MTARRRSVRVTSITATVVVMLLVIELFVDHLSNLSQDSTARHRPKSAHMATCHLIPRPTRSRTRCHGTQSTLAIDGVTVLVVLCRSLLLLMRVWRGGGRVAVGRVVGVDGWPAVRGWGVVVGRVRVVVAWCAVVGRWGSAGVGWLWTAWVGRLIATRGGLWAAWIRRLWTTGIRRLVRSGSARIVRHCCEMD